jgi:hypothetical protein
MTLSLLRLHDVWKGSVPTQLSSWAVACLKTVSKVPIARTVWSSRTPNPCARGRAR